MLCSGTSTKYGGQVEGKGHLKQVTDSFSSLLKGSLTKTPTQTISQNSMMSLPVMSYSENWEPGEGSSFY